VPEHKWVVETVDGGPVGDCDCWHCPECGVSGGPIFFSKDKPPWKPFLAGEGSSLKLSDDCDESAKIIREHTLKRIGNLPKERPDISPHYASLVRDAIKWTPEKKNVTAAYKLYWAVQFEPLPGIMEVSKMLEEAGFNVSPGDSPLGQAVRALGERQYNRRRRGKKRP
jgi:hypothetical protein